MGVTPNYGFVIILVKKILAEFAGWFECDHHIKRDKEVLHFRHDLGLNWSIYLSEVATGTFNSLLNQEVSIELSDSSVTITIPKQNLVITSQNPEDNPTTHKGQSFRTGRNSLKTASGKRRRK